MVAMARYLHLKAQELHNALISVHITIGDNLEEKIRLRDQGPDIEASAQSAALLTGQLAAVSTKHQQAQAAATFNEERARTTEWDANQLRDQLGLPQQDLIRASNIHTTALGQAPTNRRRTLLSRQLSCNSSSPALVRTMSASESLCVNVAGLRRRSTL